MIGGLVDEAFSHIGTTTTCFLATCEDGQPHVRAMTLIRRENRLFFMTGTGNAKVKDALANPRAEVCVTMGEKDLEGSIRLTGALGVIRDVKMKEDMFNYVDFSESFWRGPEDPDYTLLEFKPSRLQYMRPGTTEITSSEL